MADDSGEKTEAATDKRMKEVHSKGQLSRSQDLSAWVGVGAAALMAPVTIERASAAGTDQLFSIRALVRHPDAEAAVQALVDGAGSMAVSLGPLFAVTGVAVLATAVAQGGVHVKRMTGNYEQFDLVKGLGRVFGGQALWNGAKSLLKTAVVGLVLVAAVQGLVPLLRSGGGLSVSALLGEATGGVVVLLQAAVAAGLVLAVADVFVVQRRNRKRTRMTKKEVRDEHKSSEGDPMLKGQRRSRQLAMSQGRMMGAVADADVVLVNPTDYAVAIAYEPGRSAPRVVAKGAGAVAARIRERAQEARVPLVQDVPLARALHASCGLGEEIPVELYTPVARVLTFVMALQARGAAPGTHVPPRSTTADEVAGVLAPGSLADDAVPRRLRPPRPGRSPSPVGDPATGPPAASPPPARPAPRPAASGAP